MPRTFPELRDPAQTGFLFSPDATLVLADRIILRASHRVETVFGWRPTELQGQSIRLLYPGLTDYGVIGERARISMMSSPVYSDERFMRRRDGQVVWMEAYGHALDADDPQKLAVWAFRPTKVGKAGPADALTAAEKRVAGYLVNGFSSKEIAQTLGCSPRTVEAHRANMIRKMKVRNSFDLVSRLLGGSEEMQP